MEESLVAVTCVCVQEFERPPWFLDTDGSPSSHVWDVPSMTYRIMPMPSLLPRGLKCIEDRLG